MLDSANKILLSVMDALLGWVLALPRDAGLILLALGTALLMVLIRKFTTNQELLKRCAMDKKRLAQLKREAKAAKEKETVQRLRGLKQLVIQKATGQEWKPMLFGLPLMIVLATWMWQRMEFQPPKPNEPVTFRAEFPVSASGRLVHLAPVDGVNAGEGWIKAINVPKNEDAARAEWTFSGSPGPHVLTVRYGGRSYEHPVVIGGKDYGSPSLEHDERLTKTELRLPQVKLFGVVPGIERIGLAPWMVAYLILALLGVPLLKRLMGVW